MKAVCYLIALIISRALRSATSFESKILECAEGEIQGQEIKLPGFGNRNGET